MKRTDLYFRKAGGIFESRKSQGSWLSRNFVPVRIRQSGQPWPEITDEIHFNVIFSAEPWDKPGFLISKCVVSTMTTEKMPDSPGYLTFQPAVQ